MNLAIYRRVATKRQATESGSLEDQLIKVESWCKSNGHIIVSDYVDCGVSVFKGNYPAYNKLLTDIKDPHCEFSGVVVYSITRLSRKLNDLLKIVELIKDNGKSLYSLSENKPKNSSSFNLMLAVQGAVSLNQGQLASTYTKDRLTEIAKQGYFTGGIPPFGYTSTEVKEMEGKRNRKKLVINKKESEIVKKVFDLCRKGRNGQPMSLKATTTYLNQSGVLHRNRKWTINNLNRVLKNTCYYGDFIFRKGVYADSRYPKILIKIPKIITKDVFDDVRNNIHKPYS